MLDIHSHILPGMDDGSASPEETAELLDLMWQQGITTVVATPHFYPMQEAPDSFLSRRQAAVEQMLPATENQPKLLLGAEVAYFSGIGACEDMIPLQIQNTNLLLIEMPFSFWSDRIINEICEIPENLGLTPVLAHVNRYRRRDQFPRHFQQLKERGVYFQCNAEAFETTLNRRWALKLMRQKQLHFLGSDCHHTTFRPPNLQQAREVIEKKLGVPFFEDFNANAQALFFSKEK